MKINIPEDVITALQRSALSIQDAAELKELSEILSDESIGACEILLNHAAYVDLSAAEVSLGGLVIPQVQRYLDTCEAYERIIAELQIQHRSADKVTGKELINLFEDEQQLVSVSR